MSTQRDTGSRRHFGQLPPAYDFLLNPFLGKRMSRCVNCRGLTHPRRFALILHVEGWGLLPIGKTCRYCSRCELIHCDQNELDAELVRGFSLLDPSVIGRDYFVFGTLGIKTFNASMKGTSIDLKALRANAADFKSHLDFVYDPGGFRRDDADPATYLRNASEASKTRKTAWTTRRVVGSDSAEH